MKSILFFCLAIFFFQFDKLTAQTTYQLPPNQPEQDACNALQLCGNTFYTPYGYTGRGSKLDLDSSPCSPQPGGGEINSVWLELHTISAGNIVFTLKPVNTYDNYDFAVIDATGKNCNDLTLKDVIRCNYNNNLPGSNVNGVTGLSDTSRTPFIQQEAFGFSFCQAVFAESGGDYLIMINSNSNSNEGFTIDFTGSTAVFSNAANLQLKNVDVPCSNPNSIILKLNSNILCNSIAADGSDFTCNAPSKIISASGINCNNKSGYTSLVQINFSSALPSGKYIIGVKEGSDNNSLLGFCNNELPISSFINFIINKSGKIALDEESICYQQLPYTWHGFKLNGNDSGKTFITKSAEGCDSTTVLNLHVSQAPLYDNITTSICDGNTYTLPWGTIIDHAGTYVHHYTNNNGCDTLVRSVTVTTFIPPDGIVQQRDSTIQTGFCEHDSLLLIPPKNNFTSYLWNTGETSSTITVNVAGAYSLIAKDKYGCNTIDTFAVAAYAYPTPVFGKLERLCADSSVTLDAGNGSKFYFWNNGSRNQKITAYKPGKYWVLITSAYDCIASDTVNVVKIKRPANFLISSITKCSYQEITLSPLSSFQSYFWSNGNDQQSINVAAGGLYWLKVKDINGCSGADTIAVKDSVCPQYFYIPTAFTPNNDGQNDLFKPKFAGTLHGYQFFIYNRWGKLVFTTNDSLKGWDGNLNGFQQPIGAYMWICTYILNNQPIHTQEGTVTLIR